MGPSKVDIPHIREQPAPRYVPWRTRYLEAADTPRGIARPVLPEFLDATFAVAAESASPAGWATIESANMNRRERRAAAKNKSRTASSGAPGAVTPSVVASSAAPLYEAGLAHLRAERYLDAELSCQRALEADPNHADTLHLMGLLSFHFNQDDHAAEWISRAIQQDPKPQYLFTLGITRQRQRRFEEALQAFDRATQLKPDAVELWRHRGNVLVDLKRPDQALLSFQEVLKLNPRDRDAAYNSGSMLLRLKRLEEALSSLNLSDQLQPNHAPTLQKRALALHELGRSEEALADIKRAYALDPSQADICNNAGVFLQRLGRDDEALPWLDRALKLRPDYPDAIINKAFSLAHLRRFAEAFALYDFMKVLHPGHAEAEWRRSHLDLLLGNFEAGWAGREARVRLPELPIARFDYPQPRWLGKEPVDGKTILVQMDEGSGDTIQFVRYVPMLAARGARIILMVADTLRPLLSEFAGVSECVPFSVTTLPAFDMYCPITSLPLAFGTKLDAIPSETAYLPAPAASRLQAWEDRLGAHDRLRVGLVWSGNPKHVNDHNRSLPLSALAQLLDLDATFVSLQKDLRPEDKPTLLAQTAIVDLTDHLTDFAETAALVSCLDVVITVDTSVAHLAGALGRPTWILLPDWPDYRWLLDRDDSPWYPAVRLFRQTETREYVSVLERVRAELQTLLAARSA
jgi:tetratricopeptide (TPR) repeat protein